MVWYIDQTKFTCTNIISFFIILSFFRVIIVWHFLIIKFYKSEREFFKQFFFPFFFFFPSSLSHRLWIINDRYPFLWLIKRRKTDTVNFRKKIFRWWWINFVFRLIPQFSFFDLHLNQVILYSRVASCQVCRETAWSFWYGLLTPTGQFWKLLS